MEKLPTQGFRRPPGYPRTAAAGYAIHHKKNTTTPAENCIDSVSCRSGPAAGDTAR